MVRGRRGSEHTSLFTALTGRAGDTTGTGQSVTDMLSVGYGTSARTGRVDTAAVAKSMKVSIRTVQRWLKAERDGQPAPIGAGNLTKARRRARQTTTTKRGRAAAVKRATTTQRQRYGAKISVDATQGPKGYGRSDYTRPRRTAGTLTPDQYQELLDAYVERGDQGAIDQLGSMWGAAYLGNPDERWEFHGDATFAWDTP